MDPSNQQHYATHRRYVPLYHFLVFPVLTAHVIWVGIDAAQSLSVRSVFDVLVAFSLLAVTFYARAFAASAQDRVIRLEERTRLRRLLPDDMQADIDRFTTAQLVGLRFAGDEELPALARTTLEAGMGKEAIKKQIKQWRPDLQRL